MLTYELTNSGYVIFRDGTVLITQETVPGVPGKVPFIDDAHKQSCAEAAILELSPSAATVGATVEG